MNVRTIVVFTIMMKVSVYRSWLSSPRRGSIPCRAAVASGDEESGWRKAKNMAFSTVVAGSLYFTPLDAIAVSGGGGISGSLSGMDFTGQDLRKNSYTKAVLRQTNFSNCNLEGVSFFGALAKEAIFNGANLRNADFESADLEGADLRNAILEGAYVNNAQFTQSQIENTDWTDVVLRKDTQRKLCEIAKGTNPVTGVETRESLFCPPL